MIRCSYSTTHKSQHMFPLEYKVLTHRAYFYVHQEGLGPWRKYFPGRVQGAWPRFLKSVLSQGNSISTVLNMTMCLLSDIDPSHNFVPLQP